MNHNSVIGDNNTTIAGYNSKKTVRNKIPKHIGLFLSVVCVSLTFLIVMVLLNQWIGFGLSDNSIALTFVGVIATFVVLTNYFQAARLEGDVKERLSQIRDIEQRMNERFVKIERDISDLSRNIDKSGVPTLYQIMSEASSLSNTLKSNIEDIRKMYPNLPKATMEKL